jgi:hypothetical protein
LVKVNQIQVDLVAVAEHLTQVLHKQVLQVLVDKAVQVVIVQLQTSAALVEPVVVVVKAQWVQMQQLHKAVPAVMGKPAVLLEPALIMQVVVAVAVAQPVVVVVAVAVGQVVAARQMAAMDQPI